MRLFLLNLQTQDCSLLQLFYLTLLLLYVSSGKYRQS